MKLIAGIGILILMGAPMAWSAESIFANVGQDITKLYEESAPGQVTFNAGAGLISKYIWRGVNLNDDFVIQPDLAVHYGQITGAVWASFDTTDEANNADNQFTEMRYILQYGTVVNEFDVVGGFVFYDYPNTSKQETQELFAAVKFSKVMFTPTVSLWYDFDEVEGMWGSLSACYIESTENVIWRLDASIGMGSEDFNRHYFGVSDGGFTDITLGISSDFMVYDRIMVTPFVDWTLLIDGDIKDTAEDDSIFYGGVRISAGF